MTKDEINILINEIRNELAKGGNTKERVANALKALLDFADAAIKSTDIANNLTTTTGGKVLDAQQGRALKISLDSLAGSTNSQYQDLLNKIFDIKGKVGSLGDFNFKYPPTPEELTKFAKMFIWQDLAGKYDDKQLPDGVSVVNSFDNHKWLLNNNEQGFFWIDKGVASFQPAYDNGFVTIEAGDRLKVVGFDELQDFVNQNRNDIQLIYNQKQDKIKSNLVAGISEIQSSGASASRTLTVWNKDSGNTSTVIIPEPLVSQNSAGLATPEMLEAITDLSNSVASLLGANKRQAAIKELPELLSEQDVLAIWNSETGGKPLADGDTLVSFNANTMNYTWSYFAADGHWWFRGIDTITVATLSTLGGLLSNELDGGVFIEVNGKGYVVGWDSLKARVSNTESTINTIKPLALNALQKNDKMDKIVSFNTDEGQTIDTLLALSQQTGNTKIKYELYA